MPPARERGCTPATASARRACQTQCDEHEEQGPPAKETMAAKPAIVPIVAKAAPYSSNPRRVLPMKRLWRSGRAPALVGGLSASERAMYSPLTSS